jgi:predicted nuclease with TOPRIM domain
MVNDLNNKKANLIKENTILRETNETLRRHGMSDLKSKMRELKSEKQSLITVLNLLQGEVNIYN